MTAPRTVHSPRARGATLTAALVVLIAVVSSSWLRPPGLTDLGIPTAAPTFPGDPAAVQRGAALFAANCAACHGATGKGDGPAAATLDPKPIDFTAPIHRGHGDADLTTWIASGVAGSAMPAFAGTLEPAEIADVILYIRSLQFAAGAQAGITIPQPADCTVAPRRVADLVPAGTIVPAPAPTALPPAGSADFPWPQGEPASRDEVAAITATLHEFYACYNAGEYERQLALYSDRWLQPQFAALDAAGWQATLAYVATPATPVPIGEQQWIAAMTLVRRLPDGRIGAYVEAVDPVNHPHQINAVVILTRVGDRWLIDEVHTDPHGTLAVTPTPPGMTLPSAGVQTPIASDGLVLTVLQVPGTPGVWPIEMQLTTAGGESVIGATVELTLEMLDMEMGVQIITMEEAGDGRYRAALPIGMSGNWQVRFTVTRPGRAPVSFMVQFATT